MFGFRKKALAEKPKSEIGKLIADSATLSTAPVLTQQQVVQKFHSSPFLHLCVDKIAKSVATNKLNLYRIKSNGDREMMINHQILELLKRPNPYMTNYDFMYALQAMLDLDGNSYIMYERNTDKSIANMWLVTPSMVREEPRTSNGFKYRIVLNSTTFEVPITEMIHIKEINMKNVYGKGVGTANSVARNVQIEEYATKQANNYFYNDMTPNGIIGVEGLTEDEILEFKEKWISDQQGVINAYKMQFLNTTDFTYVKTNDNFKDSKVMETSKENQETIRIGFGISPEVLGIVESSNRATASTAKELFHSEVIAPRLIKIIEALNVTLVREFGNNLVLDFKLKSDSKNDRMLQLVQLAPQCFKMNEIRELAGLEPDSKLKDKYYGEDGESNDIED